MSNLIDLTEKIEQWAEDRNLHTANPIKQYDKLIEEFGELMKGINKQDMLMIKDSIGDMYVVMVILSKQTGNSVVNLLENRGVDTLRPKHETFNYIRYLFDLSESLTLKDNITVYPLFDIDDIMSELAKTCGEYYLDFTDCVALAYDEIKDRKGKMIDGKFVKEADL
ncbi:MazG-like family protein [Staphylococcus xylosus]|uniref:MazG-like family protein n=1 Tax=Staphylococcus xylosus TaxID=1288 RepID=UPI0015C522BC|nr:MazG-like family protein [Staphylococcus xylosus]NQD97623.1 nucleotide pyrophosphohydrolase [Staphylococcus xylosus]